MSYILVRSEGGAIVAYTGWQCVRCGGDLGAQTGGTVHCPYCKATYQVSASEQQERPPPSEASVPRVIDAGESNRVDVSWRGKWYSARVLERVGDLLWRVRYDQWGEQWDEAVGPGRMRWIDDGARRPLQRSPSVNERVEVHWNQWWYPARIVRQEHNGYFVHYEGWETSWDEVVTIERMRVPSPWTAEGVVLENARSTPNAPRYALNDVVEVFWGSRWYPARIVEVAAESQWKIHYDNHDNSWDEIVGPERLRYPGTEAVAPGKEPVEVAYNGKWYIAFVLERVGPLAWKVHYDGFSDSYDEVVGPSRIRWPGSPPSTPYTGAISQGGAYETFWSGAWYLSRVVQAVSSDSWLVHYEGWDDKWNEVVGRDRMRARR